MTLTTLPRPPKVPSDARALGRPMSWPSQRHTAPSSSSSAASSPARGRRGGVQAGRIDTAGDGALTGGWRGFASDGFKPLRWHVRPAATVDMLPVSPGLSRPCLGQSPRRAPFLCILRGFCVGRGNRRSAPDMWTANRQARTYRSQLTKTLILRLLLIRTHQTCSGRKVDRPNQHTAATTGLRDSLRRWVSATSSARTGTVSVGRSCAGYSHLEKPPHRPPLPRPSEPAVIDLQDLPLPRSPRARRTRGRPCS
jgi:hypothetical protein